MAKTTAVNETRPSVSAERASVESVLCGQSIVAPVTNTVNLTRDLLERTKERAREIYSMTLTPTREQIEYMFEGWADKDVQELNLFLREAVNRG